MRLTDYTDYALRVLMYLGAHIGQLVTIQQIADDHAISKNHLTKVVHRLGQAGWCPPCADARAASGSAASRTT